MFDAAGHKLRRRSGVFDLALEIRDAGISGGGMLVCELASPTNAMSLTFGAPSQDRRHTDCLHVVLTLFLDTRDKLACDLNM